MLFWTECSFHSETEASFSSDPQAQGTQEADGGVYDRVKKQNLIGPLACCTLGWNDAKNTPCVALFKGEEPNLSRPQTTKLAC